jgi:hypothetical protein
MYPLIGGCRWVDCLKPIHIEDLILSRLFARSRSLSLQSRKHERVKTYGEGGLPMLSRMLPVPRRAPRSVPIYWIRKAQ